MPCVICKMFSIFIDEKFFIDQENNININIITPEIISIL